MWTCVAMVHATATLLSLSLSLSLSAAAVCLSTVVCTVCIPPAWTAIRHFRGKRMNGDNVSFAIECCHVNSVLHAVCTVSSIKCYYYNPLLVENAS